MEDYSVITEGNLFKTILADHEHVSRVESKRNIRKILDKIPYNIFEDEYAILYQSAKWCRDNEMPLTRDILQQLVSNSVEDLLTNEKINISKDKREEERIEDIIDKVMTEHDLLLFEDIDSSLLEGELNLYIQTWYRHEMENLIYQMDIILKQGLRIGRKFYRGAEDVNSFYKEKVALLNLILNGGKDYLADDVNTSEEDGTELLERIINEQSNAEIVSYSGIESLDVELNGLRKAETVVIQAGSGKGKTRFSIGTLGYQSLMKGYNVLHISLEQQPTRILPMYLARHIMEMEGETIDGLDDRGILHNTYSIQYEGLVQEAIVDLTDNEEYGKLMIVGRDLRADGLEDFLNEVYDSFKFDVLILDYFGELGTSSRTMYNDFRMAASYLKSACKHFRGVGFLGVIVNQISKESEIKMNNGDLSASKLAGSDTQGLLKGADVVLTLHQTKDMELTGEMMLLVDKMRLGQIPNIKMRVDKGRCLFLEHSEEEDFI